jgi:hypothetical protein
MLQRNLSTIPLYEDLKPWELDAVATECGPQWFPRFIAKHIPQYTFRDPCRQHDFDYWVGGTELDRKITDLKFFVRMLKSGPNKKEAWRYYKLVRQFGWVSFHYGEKRTYADLEIAVDEYLA